MKLQFLGTGAADWDITKKEKGKEFRRFSSAIIDDTLLIDPGPHIFDFAKANDTLDMFANVNNVLITHSHGDHMSIDTIKNLVKINPNCIFYGDKICLESICADRKIENIKTNPINVFAEYKIDEYKIFPLPANHFTGKYDEIAMHYSIEKDNKKLFYGLDGGWLIGSTWDYLRKKQYDAMVMELTLGDVCCDNRIFTHTSIPMLKIMIDTFRRNSALADGGKIYVSHMSRTMHYDHKSLSESLYPLNVTPAYDGMVFEV